MTFAPIREKTSSSIYISILFILSILLCFCNMFHGFGEDADSVRLVESALKSQHLHTLVPSRSWGYPLYEALDYALINSFFPNLFPAKLLSLLMLLGTIYLLFKTLIKIQLPSSAAFLLCIVFLCNPLEIISGNSILETSMSIFFMMAIVYYFVCTTPGRKLTLSNYIWYGVLFGLANLARPDNMLYFPSIFIFLLLRKEINIGYAFISVIIFLAIGILPFYLIHYPIFQHVTGGITNKIVVVLKNFAATFGLPFLAVIFAGLTLMLSRFRSAIKKVFSWSNEIFRFLLIIIVLILVRVVKLSDELEYGLFIWPVIIVLLGMVAKELYMQNSSAFIQRALVFLAIATFIPNIVQLYFFKEVNFDYKFSVGLTSGVLKQEKERRVLYEEFFRKAEKILTDASDSLRDKQLDYVQHIHYTDCDTCVVMTTVRDFRLYQKTINATGTDLKRKRIVYTLDFNINRGWRNFIKDNPVPPFTQDKLVLQY
jgi:hypothetical protein